MKQGKSGMIEIVSGSTHSIQKNKTGNLIIVSVYLMKQEKKKLCVIFFYNLGRRTMMSALEAT